MPSISRLILATFAFASPLIGLALGISYPGPSSLAGYQITLNLPHELRDVVLLPNGICYETRRLNTQLQLVFPLPPSIGRYTYAAGPNQTGTLKLTMNEPGPLTLEGTLNFDGGQWTTTSEDVGTVTFSLKPIDEVHSGKLCNISARSLVNPSTPCIAGFIVTGQTPRLVLIRAVGPTLAQYGVTAAVTDPKLEVYAGQTRVGANDNWGASTSTETEILAAATQASAFSLATGSKDAALLMLLSPGIYSAMGKADQTGEVLLEVYLVE